MLTCIHPGSLLPRLLPPRFPAAQASTTQAPCCPGFYHPGSLLPRLLPPRLPAAQASTTQAPCCPGFYHPGSLLPRILPPRLPSFLFLSVFIRKKIFFNDYYFHINSCSLTAGLRWEHVSADMWRQFGGLSRFQDLLSGDQREKNQ